MSPSFWENDELDGLVQNWSVGDFEQKYDDPCKAFGVCFEVSGLLDMVPAEFRGRLMRALSVAGDPAWLSAKTSHRFAYEAGGINPVVAGDALIDQCRLGFVSGRAVLMQRADGTRPDDWTAEEREWDIPDWFWTDLTLVTSKSADWERGIFSSRGRRPSGHYCMTLTGVYFSKESLSVFVPGTNEQSAPANNSTKVSGGRPAAPWWDDLWCAVWGDIFRGDFDPKRQADVERRMLAWIRDNGDESSESTVRPRARKLFAAYSKEAGNPIQS